MKVPSFVTARFGPQTLSRGFAPILAAPAEFAFRIRAGGA